MTKQGLTSDQAERFRQWCWPHAEAMLRLARLLTHRDDLAEDLVHDAMIKAMRAIDTLDAEDNARRWLMTILRRTWIDAIRTRRYGLRERALDPAAEAQLEARSTELDDSPAWNDPQAMLERFEDEHMIQALNQLPEAMRWTLLLVDVEGLDHEQAAAVLDVPVGTIKSRAHHARRRLRTILSDLAQQNGWMLQAISNESSAGSGEPS
ncbi:RNA polymerase sigma factor [Planctomycetales bacterium ZRK34]|nr:RNA polymerase sigma factor [Planctomycetales bacterium ZRK34]